MTSSDSDLKISVIIPAHNSENVLGECLEGLKSSTYPTHEIIVVNDGSTDDTSKIAEKLGVNAITLIGHHDANHCRNMGAEVASGDILLFLDSDVIAKPDTLKNVAEAFRDKSIDGIVGLYSARHRHTNVASQYKNLWIRYSYLKSDPRIDWIFGAIAAIRKDVFHNVGGFDSRLSAKHGIDDLELGKRMTRSEYKILLNKEVEVEHLKRQTLKTLLRNDFSRSQWFVHLAGQNSQIRHSITKGFVNVYPAFVISTLASWLVILAGFFGFLFVPAWWVLLFLVVAYLGLNSGFLVFCAKQCGVVQTVKVIGVMFLDHLVCALGSGRGVLRLLFRK
jgi:cellulose synthase/poly-beta-1,6-N-acetylglucosamine synthase-like glycosyltransferase